MQFIKVDNIHSVSVDSELGKKLVKERAAEAKKIRKQREEAAEKLYFDTLKAQLKEAEQVVKDIKSALK